MKRFLNAFQRVVLGAHATDTRLGCPSPDEGARARRVQVMYELRNGNGFRQPPAGPSARPQFAGRTRGEEKRRLRELANAKETDRQRAQADLLIARGWPRADVEARFGSLQGAR